VPSRSTARLTSAMVDPLNRSHQVIFVDRLPVPSATRSSIRSLSAKNGPRKHRDQRNVISRIGKKADQRLNVTRFTCRQQVTPPILTAGIP
jgi:hypothetical protein